MGAPRIYFGRQGGRRKAPVRGRVAPVYRFQERVEQPHWPKSPLQMIGYDFSQSRPILFYNSDFAPQKDILISKLSSSFVSSFGSLSPNF